MRTYRRSSFHRLIVLPLTLVAFLSGCTYNWVEVEPPYADALAGRQPDARVTLADRRAPELVDSVRVEGDSLIGTRWGVPTERIALPLEQVQRLEVEKQNPLEKQGGLLLIGAVLSVAFLVTLNSFGNSFEN